MIIGTMLGVNFLALPRIASASSQQDAWIAVITGSFLPLLVLLLIERLGRRFPGQDFIEMSQALFGKVMGSLLAAILGIHMLCVAATVIIRFAYLDTVYLLPETPRSVICLLILLGALYVAGKGARVVARVNELMFYLYLPVLLLFALPLLKAAEYTYLMPVGGSGLGNIARSSWDACLYFGRMEFLMVAYFMVIRKDEVVKAGVSAVTFVALLYMMLTIACLLVVGPENLQNQVLPLIGELKANGFQFVDRTDLLFVAVWSVAFRPVFNMLCMCGFSFTRLLNLPEKRHYFLVLFIIGTAAYLLTFVPRSAVEIVIYTDWYGYTYPVMGLGYPLLYHLAAAVRGRKVPNV